MVSRDKQKKVVREASDIIEQYGLDGSDNPSDEIFSAWFDRQHQQLVIENEASEQERFKLTENVLDAVESYIEDKAIEKYGKNKAKAIAGINKRKQQKGEK
jgi:hypothetical protein